MSVALQSKAAFVQGAPWRPFGVPGDLTAMRERL